MKNVLQSRTKILGETGVLLLLTVIQFTHILDFVIMMPLSPQLMRIFNITAQQFSWAVSSYTFSASIVGIAGAFFVDRFARRTVMSVAYTGFLCGTLLCALSPTFYFLLFARVVAGAFGGLSASLIFSVIGDYFPIEKRGRATGIIMSAFSVASVIGIPVGLYLAGNLNWHMPFVLIVCMGVMILPFLYFRFPPLRSHLDRKKIHGIWGEFLPVLKELNHWRAFALVLVLMLSGFSVIPFISAYMVKNVGLLESQLPWIYFCGGILTFVTSRWIGTLSDKYGKQKLFYIVAMTSMLPIYLLTNLQPHPLPLILMVTTVFMVMSSGRFVPAMAIVTSACRPQLRGAFMSFYTSVQNMSSGLAAIIGGIIIQTHSTGTLLHYDYVGYFSIVCTLLSIWLISRIKILSTEAVSGSHDG